MRIAHVVRRYSRAEWGGTETVVSHTLEEQQRLGHETRVFCTSALQPDGSGFGYFYPYWPMGAADRLVLDKKGGNPYSPALFRALSAWRPDVIHIHAGGRLACAAIRLAERLGVPSVLSLHGGAAVVPKEELALMLRPLKGKLPYGGILDRLFGLRFDPVSRASAVVTLSHGEVARLKALYPRQAIRYLPNGITVPAELPTRPAFEAARRILCVSRIDYQKNQLALVELLAARADCHVTLVGPITSAWYAEKIRARAAELGVGDRLTLVPGLPPDSPELTAAFASADVFVLPSFHEPFGIVALEAMRAGLPLIAANVGGLPDFVKDGENGLLFDPADPAALASAIDRLTPELAARLTAGGYATVGDYAWPKVIARLMEIYAGRDPA